MDITLNKIFKNIILVLLLSGAMSCSVAEIDTVIPEGEHMPSLKADFTEIVSTTPGTKLSTDSSGKTSWDGTDGLTVFIASSGSDAVSRYHYEISDLLNGVFELSEGETQTLPVGQQHDWYILHPYMENGLNNPFGTSGSEFSFDGQNQDFTDFSLKHLTDFDIMTATVTSVEKGIHPEVHLQHQAVLMRFDISNESGSELLLKRLVFQAPQGVNVAGTYYVDCKKGLTPAVPTSTAVLNLTNCKVAPSEMVSVYLMMPPFQLDARSNYKVIVNTEDKEFSNSYTIDNSKVFQKGLMYPATIHLKDPQDKPYFDPEVQNVINNMKAIKTLDSFDFLNENENFRKTYKFKGQLKSVEMTEPVPSTLTAKVPKDKLAPPEQTDKAFALSYSFNGGDGLEEASLVKLDGDWFTHDFKSDLSFHPLGLSIWVKGSKDNKGVFRFILMEDEKMSVPASALERENELDRWSYYAFEDREILSREGWHQLIMPYSQFKLNKRGTGAVSKTQRLDRYTGYIIQVVNSNGEACPNGRFCVDELTQITSFKLEEQPAKFSSMFVQLHSPEYQYTDWVKEFKDAKAIGIDTWIIQYAQQYDAPDKSISFYKNTSLPWIKTKLDYIDKMFLAAEQVNVKLILGLYPGQYTKYNFATSANYRELAQKDKQVFDELVALYGNHPCLGGWYITEEFHDGYGPWQLEQGLLTMPGTGELANYLETVASHIKTKSPAQPVLVAPALWRGLPADLCGEWFQRLFSRTPSIDFLYLQDCGGRCKVDYDVDLPNWYAAIKKACDATNVKFGVDIESFKASPFCPIIGNRSKEWSDLKDQLYAAGLYTQYITNFSWETFKKGTPCYREYMRHIQRY